MSSMNFREILSADVKAIKEKLGITSYKWSEHADKLAEAMGGSGEEFDFAAYVEDGTGADYIIKKAANVTKIAAYAFYQNKALTAADFKKAIEVGVSAFANCNNLESVDLPLITSVPTSCFVNDTKLKKINIPQVTSISSNAFASCGMITEIDVPKLKTVGSNSFSSCMKLEAINLPEATSIGSSAFSSCLALKKADLTAATSIGNYAFRYCSELDTLILRHDGVCTLGTSALSSTSINKSIYVPSAHVDAYKAATNWSEYADKIKAIEDYPDICG